MNEVVTKGSVRNNHALVRSLAREAEQRISVPTLDALLLDRLMFPRKILDTSGTGFAGLGGKGEYIIVVKTSAYRGKKDDKGVAIREEDAPLRVKWLYMEWRSDRDQVLIASGDWIYKTDGSNAVNITCIGLVKVIDNRSLLFDKAGRVTNIEGAVIKLKDLNEREFYALISEFNTQGRDGFSVQTGSLQPPGTAA